MNHVNGIHHVAALTADLDRLIDFYRRVFDAQVPLDMEEEGLRHAFIEVGPNTFLHVFQIPGVEVPQGEIRMFERGRLDHIALNAASEEAFYELRRRIVGEGAGAGEVIDMGPLLNVGFTDPDGATHEVVWTKRGASLDESSKRANWRSVDPAEMEVPAQAPRSAGSGASFPRGHTS